jgi:hemerythrin
MGIEWTQRLAVGVETIDSQHRELFSRVNQLLLAMERRQSNDEVRRVVAFLTDYVATHFGEEERIMRKARYPDAGEHERIHRAFVQELTALLAQLELKGSDPVLAIQLNNVVGRWLVDHVSVKDRALGTFLASQRPVARP